MIGVIGPDDSVGIVADAAERSGLSEHIVTRAYSDLSEAMALARALDEICTVLLFTGRVPYEAALREDGFRAELDYLAHTEADLYHTVVRCLMETGGEMPVASFDTFARPTVESAFRDLGLPTPSNAYQLDFSGDIEEEEAIEDIVAFHARLQTDDEVTAAFTCLQAVDHRLRELGLRVWRVEHTTSAVVKALERGAMEDRLVKATAGQPAAGLLELLPNEVGPDSGGTVADRQRFHLRIQEAMLDYAQGLHGVVTPIGERTWLVQTTRGTIEESVARLKAGHVGHIEPRDLPATFVAGFGTGLSAASAERNARKAVSLARKDGLLRVLFPDGSVFCHAPGGQQSGDAATSASRQPDGIALGAVSAKRLLRALRRMDPARVTARGLAEAYGITNRSARRMLTALESDGVARVREDVDRSPGRGRPEHVYQIDMEQLIGATGEPA